jgi:hypothetical protein
MRVMFERDSPDSAVFSLVGQTAIPSSVTSSGVNNFPPFA